MRGQKELECFERVLQGVFYKNGRPVKDFLSQRTYLDIDDETFAKDRLSYCNDDFFVQCTFGLTEEERLEFANVIRKAKTNPQSSLFPDFVCNDGFIEHFQITSSSVNRKGAMHTRKESEFRRTVDIETKKIEFEWNETPCFDKVRSKSWVFSNPEHSYEFLVDSFKGNWERHIESYKKYTGSKQIGIFMVEYPEFALAMCENVYHDWVNGMSQGDMREQEEFKEYRLSRDKNLLKYIYQFKEEIRYVIFLNQVRLEVIGTENIPYLIKLLPWDYFIYPLVVTTVASTHSISVPIDSKQGEEANDQS